MRRDLPYVIHDTESPGTQILVNRKYKPVGSTAEDFVNYEEFTNLHVRLTEDQIRSVACPSHERGLFGDASAPWHERSNATDYLTRLKALHKLLS